MKRVLLAAAVAALMGAAFAPAPADARLPESAPDRNRTSASTSHRLANRPRGTGLAPTTWGFASKYSGTLYGSGYYPFRVDLTYAGVNSIYGYTFNYPSAGFTNDIRAVYLFDISGLVGQASPLWSAYMFDLRERPAAGASGLIAFADVNLQRAGSSYSLNGLALAQGGYSQTVDVYDAEDLENPTPFANAALAFTGSRNTVTGNFALPNNVVTTINVDVTAAVNLDAPAAVAVPAPTLGKLGTAAIALVLVASGLLALRWRP